MANLHQIRYNWLNLLQNFRSMKRTQKSKRKRYNRFWIYTSALSILIFFAVESAMKIYQYIFENNVNSNRRESILYLPEKTSVEELIWIMERDTLLENFNSFRIVSLLKRFKGPVKSGRYELTTGMSNNAIINMLRLGNQSPVKLTFNNIRTAGELARRLSKQLSSDSASFAEVLNDRDFVNSFGFTPETALCPFIPNTYLVYWNTSPKDLYERMVVEYKSFWNEPRMKKADSLKLTPAKIMTLASIVDEETNMPDEKPVIARLYLNRLQKKLPLQACPTLKYALQDFTLQRVLNIHKEVESPYNTYKHTGLPPGPIRLPSIQAIEAVLNADKNNYLYMVAKSDFSGRHHFSSTYNEHMRYAAQYQKTLNERKIYR